MGSCWLLHSDEPMGLCRHTAVNIFRFVVHPLALFGVIIAALACIAYPTAHDLLDPVKIPFACAVACIGIPSLVLHAVYQCKFRKYNEDSQGLHVLWRNLMKEIAQNAEDNT
jgi:hypothetical protein